VSKSQTAAGSPSRFEVLLTRDARLDLEELHTWLSGAASAPAADRLLAEMTQAMERLARFPNRGSIPRELLELGVQQYRQILVKPWRLVYQVQDQRVIVMLIADTRRDLASLLMTRLLRS